MQKNNFSETLEKILKKDPRYDGEAYIFVREGLDYTLKVLRKKGDTGHRHVTGKELLEGLRRYSLDQFGPMSKTVLNYWGINQCEDFAEVVFNLVENGVLGKTEQDSRDDFKGGYDFDEVFVRPFLPPSRTARPGSNVTAPTSDRHGNVTSQDPETEKLSGGKN